ncbi:hypothetical protein HQ403_00490 [Candidatus Kaiserbacteria bacterium]|nr:hypothetical protein [Candidatus Kaiserbacteria bacterium]
MKYFNIFLVLLLLTFAATSKSVAGGTQTSATGTSTNLQLAVDKAALHARIALNGKPIKIVSQKIVAVGAKYKVTVVAEAIR